MLQRDLVQVHVDGEQDPFIANIALADQAYTATNVRSPRCIRVCRHGANLLATSVPALKGAVSWERVTLTERAEAAAMLQASHGGLHVITHVKYWSPVSVGTLTKPPCG